MKCLVVIAHPLAQSLCHHLAAKAIATLSEQNHEVQVLDLYGMGFSPELTAAERSSYYSPAFDAEAVTAQVSLLEEAEALVLCFPTWWFGFPAILKGWFDRVWAPGVAYDHASNLGAIRPRLERLRHVLAVTTLGSPWWVDWLVMRRPVRRVLKTALLGACARNCDFQMLSLYQSEKLQPEQVQGFSQRVNRSLARWR